MIFLIVSLITHERTHIKTNISYYFPRYLSTHASLSVPAFRFCCCILCYPFAVLRTVHYVINCIHAIIPHLSLLINCINAVPAPSPIFHDLARVCVDSCSKIKCSYGKHNAQIKAPGVKLERSESLIPNTQLAQTNQISDHNHVALADLSPR